MMNAAAEQSDEQTVLDRASAQLRALGIHHVLRLPGDPTPQRGDKHQADTP
jgi:hypothetical protein